VELACDGSTFTAIVVNIADFAHALTAATGATLKRSPHAILDSLPSPFGHGAGVRCGRGVWSSHGGGYNDHRNPE
jgi:hypothetical protein